MVTTKKDAEEFAAQVSQMEDSGRSHATGPDFKHDLKHHDLDPGRKGPNDLEQIILEQKKSAKQEGKWVSMKELEKVRQSYANSIKKLEKYSSTVSSTTDLNADVIGLISDKGSTIYNVLHFRGKRLISNDSNQLNNDLAQDDQEVLSHFLLEYYTKKNI